MRRALIGSIVSDAKHLGELRYRRAVIQNQLRGLDQELQEIQRLTSEVEAELSETLERLESA